MPTAPAPIVAPTPVVPTTSPGAYRGTPITPGSDASVSSQIAAIDNGSAMGVDQMKNTSTTPPVIPTPTPVTGVPGLLGSIENNADTFTSNLATDAAAAEKAKTGSFDALISSLSDTPGRAELQNSIYNQNVDPLAADVNDINDQIRNEQHSLTRQLQKADLNEHGMLAGALTDFKDELQRKSLAKQADLSIIQLSRQGKFDAAKATADRAVAALFEKETQKNDLLKLAYDENKSSFTTAEQHLFETRQADRNRTLDTQKAKELARYNTTLDEEKAKYSHSLTGTGGGGTFTATQRNIGASNAGISIAAFDALSADDKNYFVNGYNSFEKELGKVHTGDATAADLLNTINTSNLSEGVKGVLRNQLGPVDTGGGGGGLWNALKGFLGV